MNPSLTSTTAKWDRHGSGKFLELLKESFHLFVKLHEFLSVCNYRKGKTGTECWTLTALKADAVWYRDSKYFFWFIAKSDLVSSFWKGDSEAFKGSRIPAAEIHVLLCLAVSLKALIWYFSSFSLNSGPLLKQVAQMSCRDKLTSPKVEFTELIWKIWKKEDENSGKAGFGALHSLQSCSYGRQCQGCFSIPWEMVTCRWDSILRTGAGRLTQACGRVVGMGHGRPWALSFLMAEILHFSLFLVSYLFPEGCSLGGNSWVQTSSTSQHRSKWKYWNTDF